MDLLAPAHHLEPKCSALVRPCGQNTALFTNEIMGTVAMAEHQTTTKILIRRMYIMIHSFVNKIKI